MCLPSGRKAGQRCDVCRDGSILVSGSAGAPSFALTFIKGASGAGENTITPAEPHAPPRPCGAAATSVGGPPFRSTRFISPFPTIKNASERLSGDQKGKVAPAVPSSGCASSELTGRTQISRFRASVKAMTLPSGDSTGGPAHRQPDGKLHWAAD